MIEVVSEKSKVQEGILLEGAKYSQALNKFQEETRKQARKAVEEAISYADDLAKDVLSRVSQEMERASSRHGVLAVKVDDRPVVELKRPSGPHLPRLILNARMGLNSLLVGPAGCGKTTAAEQLAEALSLDFGHLGLTSGASETWLFGRQTPNGFVEATFSKLYRNGGVFLADEMDAADPNLLLAINTALANSSMYNPISGETITKHKDFVFVGAMNTNGRGSDGVYSGRNRLDAATLDRFVIIAVDYDSSIEKSVCPDDELRKKLIKLRDKVSELKSPEVISTRSLQRAYLQKQNGLPENLIIASITHGWPESLMKQAGLKK